MEKGLYEKVIDTALVQELAELALRVERKPLDQADSHALLAEHLAGLIATSLRRLPSKDRLDHQRDLVNQIIGVLAERDKSLTSAEIGRASCREIVASWLLWEV